MHKKAHIENEVAMITLASAALSSYQPRIVPSIYAWESASRESSQGWTLQELMPGIPVDEAFQTMNLEGKKEVLVQMAKVLKALQDYKLPETITAFSGVTFDKGRIVSTAMTNVGAGPWSTYEAFFKGRLQVALEKADKNQYIRRWRSNGIRDRLDAFVSRGISTLMEPL